jgi:hypothetical protein
VTLEDVDSWKLFVDHLETIEPPSQMAAVLRHVALRKFMLLKGDDRSLARLKYWLLRNFDDVLEQARDGPGSSAFITESLRAALDYTRYATRMTAEIKEFISKFVHEWNGLADAHTVLQLLAYLPASHHFDGISGLLLVH